MRVHVTQTGCEPGGFREDFHQEVILELILKHSSLSDGSKHFRQASAEAGGEQDCGVLREL